MEPQVLINEIHPNSESGSEWIELLLITEGGNNNFNLENFTIFDNVRQIYKFSNEQFTNQLLVIEVSGLNNDTDSVILKDELGNVLDSFTYNQSEKGLSWSRDIVSNSFVLTIPSRNLENPQLTSTPTPTLTPTPTITPIITANSSPTLTPPVSINNKVNSVQKESQLFKKYDVKNIKLNSQDQEKQNRESRLVFLGEQLGQGEMINVIIGSFLIILSSSFLLYVKIKNQHP